MQVNRIGKLLVVGTLALGLSACGWFRSDDAEETNRGPERASMEDREARRDDAFGFGGDRGRSVRMVCPKVGILDAATKITVFAPGSGRDLTDVEYTAEFRGVTSECDRDRGEMIIDTESRFSVIATRGPAARNRQVELPIFVALTKTNERMIDKRQYPLLVKFPEGEDRVAVYDGVEGTRVYLDNGESGAEYEILVGFQLTRSQLQYNRQEAGN